MQKTFLRMACATLLAGLAVSGSAQAGSAYWSGGEWGWYITPNTSYPQEKSNWCWNGSNKTAVAMLTNYSTILSECQTATKMILNQNGYACCYDAYNSACNKGFWTQNALSYFGKLQGVYYNVAHINSYGWEMYYGEPVVIHVSWAGGGSHAVVIEGARRLSTWKPIDMQRNQVWIFDPWPVNTGARYVLTEYEMRYAYHGAGNKVFQTLWTKR